MLDRRPEDYFTLAGVRSPGMLDPDDPFPGADVPRNWQEITGYGIDSAWLRYLGCKLSEFAARVHIWPPGNLIDFLNTDADTVAFSAVVARAPRGTREAAKEIQHFLLAQLQIKAVVMRNETVWKQTQPGRWTKDYLFKVYRGQQPIVAKAFGVNARPVATNARQTKILKLMDQIGELAK